MIDRPDSVRSTYFFNPPEGCGEWLTLLRNGSIEAESYDHSERARASFGADIATILTLDYASVRRLTALLMPSDEPVSEAVSPFVLLLITKHCGNYAELKALCNANEIPYSLVFEMDAQENSHVTEEHH